MKTYSKSDPAFYSLIEYRKMLKLLKKRNLNLLTI
jgi:hypothetical protein